MPDGQSLSRAHGWDGAPPTPAAPVAPAAVASLWLAVGCAPAPLAPIRPIDASTIEIGAPDDAGSDAATAFELVGAPLIFAPTATGFGLSAVLRSGDPSLLRARVRDES